MLTIEKSEAFTAKEDDTITNVLVKSDTLQ